MEGNYTRPNDEAHSDSPQDWLAGALVFARTLSNILEVNQGVVVQSVGDVQAIFGEGLLLVCNNGSQIQIIPISDTEIDPTTLAEGDFITIMTDEEYESE